MSLKNLPDVQAFNTLDGMSFDPDPENIRAWKGPNIRAIDEGKDNVIEILDVIGESLFFEGVTARSVSESLNRIGTGDVIVHINSPGGNYFDAISIYNMLIHHAGKVTVKVLGIAASGASLIAMAGDEVFMGRGSFMLIHNAIASVVGNQHDMRAAADVLAPVDESQVDVYEARTGMKRSEILNMMARTARMGAREAITKKFADGMIEQEVREDVQAVSRNEPLIAAYEIESLLAKHGVPRGTRRELMKAMKGGMPGAPADAKPGAGGVPEKGAQEEGLADIAALLNTITIPKMEF